MNAWLLLVSGAVGMAVLFLVAWAWARRVDNYSLVDAVWAFGIGLTGVWWLISCGWSTKHWAAAGILSMWSIRLGCHLMRRIRKHHPQVDPRYLKLREVWCGRVASRFFWFFQAQAVSVVLLALPFLCIAIDPATAWSPWETAGLATCLIGILGESIADTQMTSFKSCNTNSKAVCREGLWYYSRHPNYFFEAVIWIGFYIFACGSAWGWACVHAPVVIIYLLIKVTGIPPTEEAAVRRKGDAYRRYQQTTSPLVPWPPKRGG